jgi:2-iminobutanoate/2-iminopropanoate deaminase
LRASLPPRRVPAGAGRIVKVTAFVAGLEHFSQFNAVYAEAFGAYHPTRSIVTVPQLSNGYLVEIEAVALP